MIRRLAILTIFIMAIAGCVVAQDTWCGEQTLYFNHNVSTDIPGYEVLNHFPSGAPEVDENVTITSASGLVLIDKYISPPGEPGITILQPGTRRYRTYHYVSIASGVTKIWFAPFVRFLNGTESQAPYYVAGTDDINDLTVNEYLTSAVVSSPYSFGSGDRIGIAVYANTTHASPVAVHFVYQGVDHYSHVETGEYLCAETISAAQYIQQSSAETPVATTTVIFAITTAIAYIVVIRKRGE